MKLFLITQEENHEYDAYDSAVVAAPDEETARQMDPGNGKPMSWGSEFWCSGPEHVNVKYLGIAVSSIKRSVICASFNPG